MTIHREGPKNARENAQKETNKGNKKTSGHGQEVD